MTSFRLEFPLKVIYKSSFRLNALLAECTNRKFKYAKSFPLIRYISTGENVSQEAVQEKTKSEIKKKIILTKRQPFVRNMFIGEYDKELLPFPEVLDKEQLWTIDNIYHNVKTFFKTHVNSQLIDKEGIIPEEVFQGLKDLGLFGQQIPLDYGGLDLSWTELARLGELTGLDWSIQAVLAAHGSLGTQAILQLGSEKQKAKYLPKLATGEHVAAHCFTESVSGTDASRLQSTAVLNEEKTLYILNGSKIWITNGTNADIFIVLAMAQIPDLEGKLHGKPTAFIVNKSSGGVEVIERHDTLGICGANICSINFKDTPIPADDVLGKAGDGYKVLLNMLSSGRFFFGPAACGLLKELLDEIIDYTIHRIQFEKPLIQHGLIQDKIGKMACITYAIESMVYLTAGLMDTGEDQEYSVETAILRILSTEGLWWCVNECLQIVGGNGISKEHPFARHLRNTRSMMIFEGTNEILRLYISLMGCGQYGLKFSEDIRKLRNSLLNPLVSVKAKIKEYRVKNDSIKLQMDLAGYLHPSLTNVADLLERGVMKLEYATKIVLTRYGADTKDAQVELKRLADIAVDLYAMTCCLSRASHSYCIGLRNGDHEILLAITFCIDAYKRIEKNIEDIENAPFNSNDFNYREIALRMMKFKGYAAEHPLKRN